MQVQHTYEHSNPFLYAGLVLLACAVIVGLIAENPQFSASTSKLIKDVGLFLVGSGLSSLFVDPVCRLMRTKH